MSLCNHITWLQLAGREQYYLHYGERLTNILDELTEPSVQYPSTVLCLGRKVRDLALRHIFPRNNLRRIQQSGTINIRTDSSTISSEYPIWFADSDPLTVVPESIGIPQCHENISKELLWASPQGYSPLDLVYCKLIFPFTNVICVFADDLGGLGAVATMLSKWIDLGAASTSSESVKPRVLIITTEDTFSTTHNILEMESLREKLQQEKAAISRRSSFSSFLVLRLPPADVSQLARHRRLKEVLLEELDKHRLERVKSRALFSGTHFQALFRIALSQFSKTIESPFDFITASRVDDPVDGSFEQHLCEFLYLGNQRYIPYTLLAPYVASCILLDAFPPKMHSK